jgi:hypothetical protein
VFTGGYQDALWTNVMWLFLTGSGTITHADIAELAGNCGVAYATNFAPLLDEDWFITSAQVVLYFDGDVFDAVAQSTVNGENASGDRLPANVALAISWGIASHYRGGHPRTYLCGFTSTQLLTTTTFLPATVGFVSDAANAFHTDVEDLGPIGSGITTVEHGIVSFATDGEWRDPPVFRRIQDATVDSRVDTQRRRLGADRPS